MLAQRDTHSCCGLSGKGAKASQGAATTQHHAKKPKTMLRDITTGRGNTNFCSEKLKATVLKQQPLRTFDDASAADRSVCFLING